MMRGIAIGPILFVVAILAVLVGAISAASDGLSGATTAQVARIHASTIIQMFEDQKLATLRALLNGCRDSEISFQTAAITGSYVNNNAPVSGACHVFGPYGGGAIYTPPPGPALDRSATGSYTAHRGRFIFQNIRHTGKGTVATNVGTWTHCPPAGRAVRRFHVIRALRHERSVRSDQQPSRCR